MARKTGYKQGAMSATDAVSQLQAASGKCDFKWMKAHAASARFFGAREADVKKALSKCPSKRSGMMGTKRPYLEDATALQHAYEDIENALLTDNDPDDAARAIRTYRRLRKEGQRLSAEHDKDVTRWARMLRDYEGYEDFKGVRGTPAQHASTSNKHLEAAREELEWLLYGKPKHDPKTRRKLVRKVRRHIDQGASECSWTRGPAKARCEDEVRRLDAELAQAGMGAVRSRGVPRGGCVYVVEAAGKKRKVTSDLASAKSAGKRMAKKGSAKITKACSRGRGSDAGTVVARCTSRGCA